MQTRNDIFAFLAGAAVGSLVTVAVMRKVAKHDPEKIQSVIFESPKTASKPESSSSGASGTPNRDTPSFKMGKELDTHKTAYDGIVTKPDLEEVAKKYENQDFDKEMASREHPEEDEPEEDPDDGEEEEFDEEQEAENDAFNEHITPENYMETDGFGTVIKQLRSSRKGDVIYLIPQDCAGEIYPLEDLFYYVKDNVLCDVTDAPIDDVGHLVGDALEYFGEFGADPGKVFVRNCNFGFEYEITQMNSYYGAHIYGVKDEDFEGGAMSKLPRKAGRKKADGGEGHEERDA